MSEHNALKYNPQLARLGERGFGIDDDEQSITRMSETLQGIADLWSQQEWAIYRKEIWFARVGLTSPAVVARNSAYELVNNTAGSAPVICVVRQLLVVNPGISVQVAVLNGNTAVANSVQDTCSPLDTRLPIAQVSGCGFFHGDLAAALVQPQMTLGDQNVAGTATPYSFPQYIVVPGSKLQINCPTQNQAFQLGIVFSERPPFPGELLS